MSRDHFNIVDCDATLEEAPELAEIVIGWMISEGIVVPTDSKLPGWPKHYPGGPRLGEWAASPESAGDITRQAEGVDIEIGRQVFFNMSADGWPDAICPNGHRQPLLKGDFDVVSEWYAATGSARLLCMTCQSAYPAPEWAFEPDFALGNLGFTFWNVPPLSPRLVEQVELLLSPHRVAAVAGTL
jgi:hypothetical protein